ncbi:hypothetical protein K438DRAFT_1868009, partial [Mycena galopus ATCC 62051]
MCIGRGGTRVRTTHSGDDGRPSSQPEGESSSHARTAIVPSSPPQRLAAAVSSSPHFHFALALRQYRAHMQHGGGC